MLGAFILLPLGMALAGPVAAAIGRETTLWLAAGGYAACMAAILLVPSVWTLRARGGEPVPAPPAVDPSPV